VNQQDYILRIIETAGRLLAELRRALLGGGADPGRAGDDLVGIARRAGLDLDLLRRVDRDTMVRMVSPGGEPEPGRTWLAAELFAVEGERLELVGRIDEARDAWNRALRLYALVDPGLALRGMPETSARVEHVRTCLARVTSPPPPGAA
jgi:hypothetical protein